MGFKETAGRILDLVDYIEAVTVQCPSLYPHFIYSTSFVLLIFYFLLFYFFYSTA